MIVATAGHIDHGKTSLVKALTGVDTDRLAEEKRRGMTIDLGFAYAGALGFVDVPGHERFIHNMLAGVSGIDLALLVVAADDGPMPQTREHLTILKLLGVPRIAVAVTKIDRVGPARVAQVRAELSELLPGAPQFDVSCVTGDGVDALGHFLAGKASGLRERVRDSNFRMSVDRAFSLPGAGLIVTGTAMSGGIAVGEPVRALLAGTGARVRGIHAQNAPAQRGRAGQRVALNLAGFDARAPIKRGDWIVAGAAPAPVRRFDAQFEWAGKPARNGTPVHVHLGAADVMGRIAVLALPLVQIVLERPVGAAHGDRFVVRCASAQRTLGGGRVIDVFAPSRGRAKAERLASLEAMALEDDEAALTALLECSPLGVDMACFAANRNLPAASGCRFSAGHWNALRERAIAGLAAWHAQAPGTDGMPKDRLLEGVRVARGAAAKLVEELIAQGRVVQEARGLRLAAHRMALNPAEATLWKKLLPLLESGGLRPPTVAQLASTLELDARQMEKALARLAAHKLVVRVSANRYFLPGAVDRLESIAGDMVTITAAAFRDRTGLGRGLAIEVLEYFDRTKVTSRVGDAHLIRTTSGKDSHPGGARGLQLR